MVFLKSQNPAPKEIKREPGDWSCLRAGLGMDELRHSSGAWAGHVCPSPSPCSARGPWGQVGHPGRHLGVRAGGEAEHGAGTKGLRGNGAERGAEISAGALQGPCPCPGWSQQRPGRAGLCWLCHTPGLLLPSLRFSCSPQCSHPALGASPAHRQDLSHPGMFPPATRKFLSFQTRLLLSQLRSQLRNPFFPISSPFFLL